MITKLGGGGSEIGAVSGVHRGPRQPDRQVGLADPWRADEQEVRRCFEVAAGPELGDQLPKDLDWDGQTIRAGDKVVCWFQAANRDSAIFPDPDVVKIDRADNDHVGFGWGIHACMGSHLARAEVTAFFRALLDRGLRIRPLGPPDRLHTNQFNAFKRLHVRVEKEGS